MSSDVMEVGAADTEAVPGVETADAPGGVMRSSRRMSRNQRRLAGLVVALGCAALLGLAAWMEPSEGGVGTHQQLNLPPCGWVMAIDVPCPTCGMTTSFSHAADGRLWRAFTNQPLGGLLALATAMTLLVSTYVAVTGSRVGLLLGTLLSRQAMWWLLGLAVVSWLYKIATFRGLL